MGIYEELQARGLIAQVTDEPTIRDMVNNGKATFYIGFDCTADSLHVGHFMALCLMKRLQMAGNKPIALIGDGTTRIGDPSGRTDMRKMLTPEETVELIGHAVGGVCPFAVKPGVKTCLDVSLQRFTTVFPACGSSNSAIELTCEELYELSEALAWVDVCKGWQDAE